MFINRHSTGRLEKETSHLPCSAGCGQYGTEASCKPAPPSQPTCDLSKFALHGLLQSGYVTGGHTVASLVMHGTHTSLGGAEETAVCMKQSWDGCMEPDEDAGKDSVGQEEC